MRNNYRSKSFKKWLDQLQQESWQLELIISGFSIYGLSQAIGPLGVYFNIFQNEGQGIVAFILTIALISCSILMFTLILHVILRGLWIGALGLRYVSGDIDYKALNYSSLFDKYLRKRIGSFDKYIARLEDYCSVLFALSFLLVFYVISAFLTIGVIASIAWVFFDFGDSQTDNSVSMTVGIILICIFLIGVFLNFIDFVTQGILKKYKWTSLIYFPFYWVFSFITLSFLYRPLVYNFLDNKFGKRLSLFLVPLYAIIIYTTTLNYNRSNYLDETNTSSSYTSNKFNYEDLIEEEGEFINEVSIPSKIIEKPYLPVFFEYYNQIETEVFKFNNSLKPKEDKRGVASSIELNINSDINALQRKKDSLTIEYLKTLKHMYNIKIDSINITNYDFVFTTNKQNQLGFETVLDLDTLPKGKHVLHINRLEKLNKTDSTVNKKIISIPFWYYKN
ncbi:hypothetical protein [Lacinutrix salivirga]